MISAWLLLLIVPLSASFGFLAAAIMTANKENYMDDEVD